jgi:hypothetical protein
MLWEIWGSHGGEEDDRPDDGGSKHLWNVGKLTPDHTAQQPRRQLSYIRSCENYKSHVETVCFSETLVSTYDSIRRHNPEEQHQESFKR